MYTSCSAPPRLSCINFRSWWERQTPKTGAKRARLQKSSVCQGMEGAATPGQSPKEERFSLGRELGLELRTCRSRSSWLPLPSQERHLRVSTPGQCTLKYSPSPLSLPWARGPRPGNQPPPATYPGSGPHSGAPALGSLRLFQVHGVRAPTFAPLTRRRRKKKVVRTPHPDSSLSPQPPRTAAAAGNTSSSHLLVSTRKYTLRAKKAPTNPTPRKLNPSREPEGEEGQC